MADLVPSLLEGDLDLMHADLDLLEWLDELNDPSSNHITNIADNMDSNEMVLPPKTSGVQGEPSGVDEKTIAKNQ